MMVKVEIRGDRAFVSGPPGSKVSTFEASATRLRSRFAEQPDASGRLVGYFEADERVLGESMDPKLKLEPRLADVFEIGNRVHPKEEQRW